jgi:protein-disulfide isomerase
LNLCSLSANGNALIVQSKILLDIATAKGDFCNFFVLQKTTHLTFVALLLSFLFAGSILLSASTNVHLFSYMPYLVYGQTGPTLPDNNNTTMTSSIITGPLASNSSISNNYTTSKDGGNASSNKLALSNLIQGGAPYLGNTNASITIIDFSDFQCPKCARYVKNTEPQIKSQYVETGKVALVFQHFPRLGADSVSAGLASQCVAEQGNEKFWQFHDILYQNQGPENSGWASIDHLKEFALQITGINKEEFNSCLDDEKYKQYIDNDLELVRELGFQDTPSFIIMKSDGTEPEKLIGPHPFASFQFIIDNKLNSSN